MGEAELFALEVAEGRDGGDVAVDLALATRAGGKVGVATEGGMAFSQRLVFRGPTDLNEGRLTKTDERPLLEPFPPSTRRGATGWWIA
jgi:hypothetical protein